MTDRGEALAKTAGALPGGMPGRGAPAAELLDWCNTAAHRDHDPVVAVRRWGFELDARLRLEFESGNYVRVRQRDLMGANGLRHVLQAYDGGELPAAYKASDCQRIVTRLIWASEASVRDDELDALLDDLGGFLEWSLAEGGLLRGSYAGDGYRLVADLAALNRRRTGNLQLRAPALALDTSADPPVLWVPRAPLFTYLRELRHKADPPTLRGELEEVGWQRADFQRRQPHGGGRPKVRVWVVSAGWERCPFDLAAAVEQAGDASEVGPPKPRRDEP